ncbi:DUF3429 domain-containing protein [Saccharospirillum impatiens]|uniref:DUF3429 domain-containing protein n=1 Tax=Saccharospirillum impatiens TaxID=169438 RepID=UPI000416506D|nr:DUF3429 domain-containing protein [Saccharospirillum impatiens]
MTPTQTLLFWSLGGLMFFWVGALLLFLDPTWVEIYISFSALILSFLSGSLWVQSASQDTRRNRRTLNLTMGYFLLAWLALFLPAPIALALLGIAYPALWWQERDRFFQGYTPDYRRLRTLLSWGVAASHVPAAAALIGVSL